jgi:hypothetical protein
VPDTPAPDARARDAARRRALAAAARDSPEAGGFARRVRPEERRRYVFQVWTTSAFAAVWVLVFVLSGSWFFLVLAGACALLAVLAATALAVLRRRPPTAPPPPDRTGETWPRSPS